jgi:hypothetical protein
MSMQFTDSVTNQQGIVASSLSTKITEYSEWRENLIATIDQYIDWLGSSDSLDALQELRLLARKNRNYQCAVFLRF